MNTRDEAVSAIISVAPLRYSAVSVLFPGTLKKSKIISGCMVPFMADAISSTM